MKYELRCRVCGICKMFDSVEKANDSDWTEVSALGAIDDGVSTHRAYCPPHSL